jgi:prepilin-type processing-associated H-X9-DG protein
MTAPRALCDYAASNLEGTGVITRFTPGRMADIADGTAFTLLVGEKRINRRGLGRPQPDDNLGYSAGFDEDTVRRTDKIPMPDYNGPPTANDLERFGASHPGRFNAVFADGSVRSVPYSIDKAVFTWLGHKADGQVIGDF